MLLRELPVMAMAFWLLVGLILTCLSIFLFNAYCFYREIKYVEEFRKNAKLKGAKLQEAKS